MAESVALFPMGARRPLPSLRELVDAYERRLILEALARSGGNQRRAASELGCLPTTLNEKMRRLGLRACDRMADAHPDEAAASESALELTGIA